jgi:CBS domain-containing protein
MSVSGLISQILTDKTSDIWSIAPDASVYDAIEMMAEKNAGALLVMEGEKLAGIISERDYSRKVILQGKSSKKTPVSEIMTTDPNTTVLGDTVEKCLRMMTGNPCSGQRQGRRHRFDWRSGEVGDLSPGIHDQPSGKLHFRRLLSQRPSASIQRHVVVLQCPFSHVADLCWVDPVDNQIRIVD